MWNEEEINQYDSYGLKHGLWKNFFMHSDKVSSEETYLNGVLNGYCKYFWSNTEIKREGAYRNGQEIDLWIFNPGSPISSEIIYIR